MDIQIVEGITGETKVIIKCRNADSKVYRLKTHIEIFDSKLTAKTENEICYVNLTDILYFESVDSRTFLYTENSVMQVKQKLYELELMLPERNFIRTSKSQILNIVKLESLRPEINRTILATMCNGEKLCVSRKYVPALKKLLSI